MLTLFLDWIDGSEVSSTCCSSRGPELSSQRWCKQPTRYCNSSSRGAQHPLLTSSGTHIHVHIHTDTHSKSKSKIKTLQIGCRLGETFIKRQTGTYSNGSDCCVQLCNLLRCQTLQNEQRKSRVHGCQGPTHHEGTDWKGYSLWLYLPTVCLFCFNINKWVSLWHSHILFYLASPPSPLPISSSDLAYFLSQNTQNSSPLSSGLCSLNLVLHPLTHSSETSVLTTSLS